MSKEKIEVSCLRKTWIFDIDGTIAKHNGYKIDGYDSILPGAKEFFSNIHKDDMIILITSRTEEFKDITEKFLNDNKIRFDHIIYNAPFGERILINDKKPSGLITSIALNTDRDRFLNYKFQQNSEI